MGLLPWFLRRWFFGPALVFAACSGSSGGSDYGIAERATVAALPLPTGLPSPIPVQLVDAFPGLVFDAPIFLTAPPDGTDRIVVAEQRGVIRIFPNDALVSSTTTLLDISARVQFGGEEGLLGFAFHPDYATNGWFYVYYTAGSPRRSVLSRFTISSGDPDVANPASETILLEVAQPFGNHNSGSLAFGPDSRCATPRWANAMARSVARSSGCCGLCRVVSPSIRCYSSVSRYAMTSASS